MPSVRHKRGTLAQINAAASANGLKTGEVYLITDQSRLTVATAINAHQPMLKQGEGGGSASGFHAPTALPVGCFASLQVNASALSTIATAANRLDFAPFIPAQTFTVDQLSVEVATAGAAGTLARLGIFASDANGEPGAEIVEGAATIDTASVGNKTAAIAATQLQQGVKYWLAILSSGAPTYRGVPLGGLLMLSGDATATGNYTCRRATFAFAALPAKAPATVLTSSIVPQILLRKSA